MEASAETERILSQLAALDTQIVQINRTIVEGERQAVELQAMIDRSSEKLVRVELRRDDLKKMWNQRARRIYKDSPGTAWAPLFSAQTWGDVRRLKRLWKYLAEGDAKLVSESASLKEQLLTHRAHLVAASESLTRQTQGLGAAREKLRRSRQERTTSLGQLRYAIGQAMLAEEAALSSQAIGVRIPHACSSGSPVQDERLAELLDWLATAAVPDPSLPAKLSPTDVILTAQASWYGPGFEGCRASSGATFRSNQMTAASLTLPFGTLLKVGNAGKSAVVVITDRGPYVPNRELDLSHAAAQAIGLPGVGQVTMEVLLPAGPAPPFP